MLARFEGPSKDKPVSVDVLACNWTAVQVFLRCEFDYIGGMSVHCAGVNAQEIQCAMDQVGVKRKRWLDVSDSVRVMSRVATACINDSMKR